jgi:hypothetical protein
MAQDCSRPKNFHTSMKGRGCPTHKFEQVCTTMQKLVYTIRRKNPTNAKGSEEEIAGMDETLHLSPCMGVSFACYQKVETLRA